MNDSDLIILSPIIGSLGLTLVYFMGARWRYYAEPFMIIYAAIAITTLIAKYNKNAKLTVERNKLA
jgi:hypothetical protein